MNNKLIQHSNNLDILDNLIDYNYLLIFSCENGIYNLVKLSLENKANIHYNNDYVLRISTLYGYDSIVKLLLDYGANVYSLNNEAIHLSFIYNHTNIFKTLLQYVDDDIFNDYINLLNSIN